MPPITNDWAEHLKEEYKKPYYKKLYQTVTAEYAQKNIFPPADDIFNAFHLTPLSRVKVVILGQDPYHNVGQAHGLSFSEQGVLLLNTVLTVQAHKANSHKDIGWEEFTDAAIRILNEQDRPIVYLLWGRNAQNKKWMLTNPKHLVLEAPHPSPFSASRGFFGCRHFSRTNEFLKEHGIEPVDWQIENI